MRNTNHLPFFSSSPAADLVDDLWAAWIAPAIAGWRISSEARASLHIAEGRAELAAIVADARANHDGYMPMGWQTRVTITISRGVC